MTDSTNLLFTISATLESKADSASLTDVVLYEKSVIDELLLKIEKHLSTKK